MDDSPSHPRTRVAVIAVHGVADQAPDTSNAAVASMLAQLTAPGGGPAYSAFERHEVHLPQHPVRVIPEPEVDVPLERLPWWALRPRREYLEEAARAVEKAKKEAEPNATPTLEPAPEPEGELGYRFMRMQLRDYDPGTDARTYATTVLRSTRRHAHVPAIAVEPFPPCRPASAERGARPGGGTSVVDVFEVYWADLSRPTSSLAGLVTTVYQLALHLATLGRQAVEDTRIELPGGPWPWLRELQRLAVWLLTVPVVLLNLLLLVVGFGVVPATTVLGREGGALASALLLGAVVGGLLAYVRGQRVVARRAVGWSLVPLAGAAAGAGVAAGGYWLAVTHGVLTRVDVVALGWLIVGGGLMVWVACAYQPWRVGVVPWTLGLLAAAVLLFGFFRRHYDGLGDGATDVQLLNQAALSTLQWIYVALRVAWTLLLACVAGLWVGWWTAWWTTRPAAVARARARAKQPAGDPAADEARWGRGRAALRTGRLGIALSTVALLAVSLPIWAGVFAYTTGKLGAFGNAANVKIADPPAWTGALLPSVGSVSILDIEDAADRERQAVEDSAEIAAPTALRLAIAHHRAADARLDTRDLQGYEYLTGLMVHAVTTALPFSIALVLLALALLGWMAMPSIRAEGEQSARSNGHVRRLGQWLSRGLDATRWVAHLLVAAMLVMVLWPLLVAVAQYGPNPIPAALLDFDEEIAVWLYGRVGVVGGLVSASALAAFGLLRRYGGSAIDVVLDVDNYLRAAPRTATPRARIAQRYAAVLRHIASDGPGGGRRYDGVVIVAHSLGGLITAELLRYLVRERWLGGDPALARLGFGPADGERRPPEIPVTLVTMGVPLRQLLARFFPHRYEWVCPAPDNGVPSPPDPDPPEPKSASNFERPSAWRLGVAHWENLYRSGDYVGRGLWLDGWYRRCTGDAAGSRALPLTRAEAGGVGLPTVAEACIGSGAHTHYWDATAPDVAERLDALIGVAERP